MSKPAHGSAMFLAARGNSLRKRPGSSLYATGFRVAVCCGVLNFVLGIGGLRAAVPPPSNPQVNTIAGSGESGVRDGRAAQSQFLEPVALAYGREGQLFIVDRAAQRVRALSVDGKVTTVAGSGLLLLSGLGVAGGYRDGLAMQARFNEPSGIAVNRKGDIFVADTKNHCVRMIRHGIVTTFVGRPSEVGDRDGQLNNATLEDPRSLSFDSDGDLFVADPPNGIRKITPAGTVSTIRTKEPVVAVLVAKFRAGPFRPTGGEVLLASDVDTITAYDPSSGSLLREISTTFNFVTPLREGYISIGPAASLAAITEDSIVYTDPLYRTIRWLVLPAVSTYVRTLGAEPLENAAEFGGAFRDGPGNVATFVAPMGVAKAPDGSIVVADSGAKRIRRLGKFDLRNGQTTLAVGDLPQSAPPANEYRIALVGSSDLDAAHAWNDTIPGILESELGSEKRKLHERYSIWPVRREGIGPLAALDLIDTYLSAGTVDMVVFCFPNQVQFTSQGLKLEGDLPKITERMKETKAALLRNRIPFYVVTYPGPYDVPGEMNYALLPAPGREAQDLNIWDPMMIQEYHDAVMRAIRSSGATLINVWPDFYAYRSSRFARPLFGAWDHHPSAIGMALIAKSIARSISPAISK